MKTLKQIQVIFGILILLFSSVIYGQDSISAPLDAPRIVTKLNFGTSLSFDDVELKFVEVLQDSRCPKNVTCVWAGEVVVLVDVFKNGNKTTQKKLTLSPTSHLQNLLGNILSTESLTISGFNVLPYPESGNSIKKEDYYIQLEVKNN